MGKGIKTIQKKNPFKTSRFCWRSNNVAGYMAILARMAMWALRTFGSVFSSSLHFLCCGSFGVNLLFLHAFRQMLVAVTYFVILLFAHLVYSHCGRKHGAKTMRAPESPRSPHILSLLKALSPWERSSEDQTQYSANICAASSSAWNVLLLYYHVFQNQETKTLFTY